MRQSLAEVEQRMVETEREKTCERVKFQDSRFQKQRACETASCRVRESEGQSQ